MNENGMLPNSHEDGNGHDASVGQKIKIKNSTPLTLAKAKKAYSGVGFGLAIFSVIYLISSILLEIIAILFAPQLIEEKLFPVALSGAAQYLCALPILLLVLYALGGKSKAPEKKKMGFGALAIILIVSFGLMYIGSFTGQFVMWGVSEAAGYNYSDMLGDVIDLDKVWLTFIFMCVVAPIGEEFVFRKLIIDKTQKYGGLISIFFSALAFGLMHANFYQFFYAFLMGLVLGYVYYSTGNMWYSVALHAIINFVGSIVTSYIALGSEQMLKALEGVNLENTEEVYAIVSEFWHVVVAEYACVALIIIAMICAVVLPIVFRKRIKVERAEFPAPRNKVLTAAFLNAGAIMMILVYLSQFALTIVLPLLGT